MKIATWNVNSLKVRLPQVMEWLHKEQPDVLALQEIKMLDEFVPVAELNALGYQVIASGQRTYNGVAILSKQPAVSVIKDLPGLDDPQRRVLAATVGNLRVINLYIPNGQSLASEKYQYKMTWLEKLLFFLKMELQNHEKLVVVGDFNIAPAEIDVHDPKVWADSVLFSPAERATFAAMLDLGLVDCYRSTHPEAQEYSWWDYRLYAFKRNLGLRIDHILASNDLVKLCKDCQIDKTPRSWERPSDHAPVWAKFSLEN